MFTIYFYISIFNFLKVKFGINWIIILKITKESIIIGGEAKKNVIIGGRGIIITYIEIGKS